MIKLPMQVQKNCDQSGMATFTQIKRTDKVAMYKRVWNDNPNHIEYNVFEVKFTKKGTTFPNGIVVEDDTEQMAGASAGGRYAFFCNDEDRAEIRYKELINKVASRNSDDVDDVDLQDLTTNAVSNGKRGRKQKTKPTITIPTSKTFTMNDLYKVNGSISKTSLYFCVKEDSRIKRVGTKPNESGRGLPSIIYAKA